MPFVLFLCTGNYYRSRFAESVFNYYSMKYTLGWRAISRGLDIKKDRNPASLSPLAMSRLKGMGITPSLRKPRLVQDCDLQLAAHVVALNADEHRPMLATHFGDWLMRNTDRLACWQVGDIEVLEAEEAFRQIERAVVELCNSLAGRPEVDRGPLSSHSDT